MLSSAQDDGERDGALLEQDSNESEDLVREHPELVPHAWRVGRRSSRALPSLTLPGVLFAAQVRRDATHNRYFFSGRQG